MCFLRVDLPDAGRHLQPSTVKGIAKPSAGASSLLSQPWEGSLPLITFSRYNNLLNSCIVLLPQYFEVVSYFYNATYKKILS